jgi:uncharacterized repeat protein (TIGR01451 family)
MYRLRIFSLLVVAALSLTFIIGTGADLSAQEEDVLLYLPIILKDHDSNQPWHYLSVDKAALANRVQPGGLLTYTIRYSVGGNEPAPGLTLVDTLPPSTTFKTCTGDFTCDHVNGTATWNLGTVAPPSTGLVTLTVQVDSSVISGTVLSNGVSLADLSGLSATDTVTTPVQDIANLDVAIVFDISGSMQFDTTCYGCYEPYRDGTKDWEDMSTIGQPDYDPDFSIDYPNPVYVNPIPVDHLPTTYLDGSSISLSYGFAAGNTTLPDPPTPQNAESLCADRDTNTVDYKTIVGGSNPVRFVIIEAELYSLNTSLLAGPFRQPGRGYWALQHTNWRTVHKMLGENWDPDGSYATGTTPILPSYGRGSWVSHHPYVSWALEPPLSIPFGHDYTLAEVRASPNDVPSLEYDFFISGNASDPWQDDGDTRIWARVQDGGNFAYDESGYHNSNIYWALYDYSELQVKGLGNGNPADDAVPLNGIIQVSADTPGNLGANYGGADGDRWDWIELTSAGLDLPDDVKTKYTLKIWAGGAGYDIDQIVIGNANDHSFTTNYSNATPARYSTSSYATPGSAFRQACNHCNPIYGLLINDRNECTPNKDNGWSIISEDGTDNGDPIQERLFGGYQPLRNAKEATKHFIARLNPQFDQVGIVSYSTYTPVDGRMELRCRRYYNADQCFQGSSPISYTEVLDVLERVPPNGSTNLAEGMLRGLEMLGINANNLEENIWIEANDCDSPADHCSRGGSARRVMIVLTDGVANKNPWDDSGVASENCYAIDLYQPNGSSQYENRAKDCAYFYAQKAASNKVTIYTIGLGNGIDVAFLETIATLPGSDGAFFSAVTSSHFDEILETIRNSK